MTFITATYAAAKKLVSKAPLPIVMGHPPSPPPPSPVSSPISSSYSLSAREQVHATKLKITLDEYRRRDNMVREAAKNCPFKAGDVLAPRMEESHRRYGMCRILHVVDSYYEYSSDSAWDNVVRIVGWECDKPTDEYKGKTFFSTVNFFDKK